MFYFCQCCQAGSHRAEKAAPETGDQEGSEQRHRDQVPLYPHALQAEQGGEGFEITQCRIAGEKYDHQRQPEQQIDLDPQ